MLSSLKETVYNMLFEYIAKSELGSLLAIMWFGVILIISRRYL